MSNIIKNKITKTSKPNYLITLDFDKLVQNLGKKSLTLSKNKSKNKTERGIEEKRHIKNILLKQKKENLKSTNNRNHLKSKQLKSIKNNFNDDYTKLNSVNKGKFHKLNNSLIINPLQKKRRFNMPNTLYFDSINKKNKKFNKKKTSNNISNNYSIIKNVKIETKNSKIKSINRTINHITYLYKPIINLNANSKSKLNDFLNYSPRRVKIRKSKHRNICSLALNSLTLDEDKINNEEFIMNINYNTLSNSLNNVSNRESSDNEYSQNNLYVKEKYLISNNLNKKNKQNKNLLKEAQSVSITDMNNKDKVKSLNLYNKIITNMKNQNIFKNYKNDIRTKKINLNNNYSDEYDTFNSNKEIFNMNLKDIRIYKKNDIYIDNNNNLEINNINKKTKIIKDSFSLLKTRNNQKFMNKSQNNTFIKNRNINNKSISTQIHKNPRNIISKNDRFYFGNSTMIENQKYIKNKKIFNNNITTDSNSKINRCYKSLFLTQPYINKFNLNIKKLEKKNHSKVIFNKKKDKSTSISPINNKNIIINEYPNMSKYINGIRRFNIEMIESTLNKSFKKRETKVISNIFSLCRRGFSGPNIKKTNQDNFFIYHNFNNNANYVYMGVCDGHGIFGQNISTYLVNNLPQNMSNSISKNKIKNLSTVNIDLISNIFRETYIQTNSQMNHDERIDSSFSGSTCVSLLFTPTKVFCINVGDSRCIIGQYNGNNWISQKLSRDHKPNETDEKNRIIKNGGRVESYRDKYGNLVGPERVWAIKGPGPGLAMSRSFGDEVAHRVGVSVEPEIVEHYLLKEDKFIILASDGIWEFISNEEVVDIVKNYYLENDIIGAITFLYNEASRRWIMEEDVIDDITVIIIFLK